MTTQDSKTIVMGDIIPGRVFSIMSKEMWEELQMRGQGRQKMKECKYGDILEQECRFGYDVPLQCLDCPMFKYRLRMGEEIEA